MITNAWTDAENLVLEVLNVLRVQAPFAGVDCPKTLAGDDAATANTVLSAENPDLRDINSLGVVLVIGAYVEIDNTPQALVIVFGKLSDGPTRRPFAVAMTANFQLAASPVAYK